MAATATAASTDVCSEDARIPYAAVRWTWLEYPKKSGEEKNCYTENLMGDISVPSIIISNFFTRHDDCQANGRPRLNFVLGARLMRDVFGFHPTNTVLALPYC